MYLYPKTPVYLLQEFDKRGRERQHRQGLLHSAISLDYMRNQKLSLGKSFIEIELVIW